MPYIVIMATYPLKAVTSISIFMFGLISPATTELAAGRMVPNIGAVA
jgi:hypothetical protein